MNVSVSSGAHMRSFRRYQRGQVVGGGGRHQRGPWRWSELTGMAVAGRSLTNGHDPRSKMAHEVISIRRL
jgi:hypothetical protein